MAVPCWVQCSLTSSATRLVLCGFAPDMNQELGREPHSSRWEGRTVEVGRATLVEVGDSRWSRLGRLYSLPLTMEHSSQSGFPPARRRSEHKLDCTVLTRLDTVNESWPSLHSVGLGAVAVPAIVSHIERHSCPAASLNRQRPRQGESKRRRQRSSKCRWSCRSTGAPAICAIAHAPGAQVRVAPDSKICCMVPRSVPIWS